MNAGVLLDVNVILGNQNQRIEVGTFGVITANYNDIALESAINIYSGQLLKRHTAKVSGWNFGYEFYSLLGIGRNNNLLGSSISSTSNEILFNANGEGGFSGIGLGFQKEFLPGSFSVFNLKRGKLIMRFSNANHSIGIAFINDLKFGKLFNGQATDYGATGSLEFTFSAITSIYSAYKVGVGIELFTPKADYSRTPNNFINSDDGRKNSWHTLAPYDDLFYANLYVLGNYVDNQYSVFAKTGLNSQKLGAYIQNTIHDGFGLNPRYPWKVDEKDKLFIEVGGSLFLNNTSND